MLHHSERNNDHPGRGLDAALDATLSADPLVGKVRELIKATVFESEVRRHPEKYFGDPRAAVILAQITLEKKHAELHAHKFAFASGRVPHEDTPVAPK
jgi:hypothetical protein